MQAAPHQLKGLLCHVPPGGDRWAQHLQQALQPGQVSSHAWHATRVLGMHARLDGTTLRTACPAECGRHCNRHRNGGCAPQQIQWQVGGAVMRAAVKATTVQQAKLFGSPCCTGTFQEQLLSVWQRRQCHQQPRCHPRQCGCPSRLTLNMLRQTATVSALQHIPECSQGTTHPGQPSWESPGRVSRTCSVQAGTVCWDGKHTSLAAQHPPTQPHQPDNLCTAGIMHKTKVAMGGGRISKN